MAAVKTTILPVTGMTCANCAGNIDRNVRKLPGVSDALVDFAGEKLTVSFDPAQLSEKEIIACVRRIGFGVATGKLELPITGLQDQTDVVTMEKILSRQNVVLTASVGYGTERVTLEYIPKMTSVAELIEVIRAAGFAIVQVGDSEEVMDVEAEVRTVPVKRYVWRASIAAGSTS